MPCGVHMAVVTKGRLGGSRPHHGVFRRGDQKRRWRSRLCQLRNGTTVSVNAVWLSQVTKYVIMWLGDVSSLCAVEFLAISEWSAYLIYKIISDLITVHSLLQESQQISAHIWKTQDAGRQRRHHYCIRCECIGIRATFSSFCSVVIVTESQSAVEADGRYKALDNVVDATEDLTTSNVKLLLEEPRSWQ